MFLDFGDIHGPKPYKFIGFGDIPHLFLEKGARRAGFPARRAGRPFQTSFGEAEGRWEGFPELSRGP
jgi:hypothetical protein